MSTPALGGLPPPTELRQFSPATAPLPPGATSASQEIEDFSKGGQTGTAAGQSTENTPTPATEVEQALDEVRQAIRPVARNLLFSIDEDTGKTVIKVIDTTTDEVIRQIPSEEIIAIAKALDKLQGLLLRQEA
ncbi:flagellar protein FlaG [Pseudothauera rhizosphaerae]|uniref:Flagellar protein FlaG n=1 Tax=Pseudothauera rhizosphaerae TaxID=2565932 RepID=A0A4S4AVU9_9RHOO|nr:flagellar protein FlaG [Pseudothauera rhizosphaerae]THF64150.1 flagellar protein FlaG [Pseudothauera rhizosphaerae]